MATIQEIREHYDTSADLFGLFLDRTYHSYSAGRWKEGDDLISAQKRNLAAITSSLKMGEQSTVLDIGCGWGAFLRHYTEEHNIENYVGITPSHQQISFLEKIYGAAPSVKATTWQDFADSGETFDAIVALESAEHIASYNSRRNGTAALEYQHFFKSCAALSNNAAPFYLQASVVKRLPRSRSELQDWNFLLLRVFPGSALPDLEILEQASTDYFQISEAEFSPDDYLKTLAVWSDQLRENEEIFRKSYGDKQYSFYSTYLDSCSRLFDAGVVSLLRLNLRKTQ